jgi:hypothetical protein
MNRSIDSGALQIVNNALTILVTPDGADDVGAHVEAGEGDEGGGDRPATSFKPLRQGLLDAQNRLLGDDSDGVPRNDPNPDDIVGWLFCTHGIPSYCFTSVSLIEAHVFYGL